MIRFHYHTFPRSIMLSHGLPVGRLGPMVRCCHVWSDTSIEDLRAWAASHGISFRWAHVRADGFTHLDLWGRMLRHCGEGALGRELARDMETWAEHRRADAKQAQSDIQQEGPSKEI